MKSVVALVALLKGCRGMAASAPDAAAPRCGSRAAVMKRTLEDAARAAAEHAAEWFGSGGWDLRGLLNGREELTLRAPCSHRVRTSLHDLIHCLRRSVARSHGATVSSGARLLLELWGLDSVARRGGVPGSGRIVARRSARSLQGCVLARRWAPREKASEVPGAAGAMKSTRTREAG